MAYMSQEMKKSFAPAIKAVLEKYNMKGSLSVEHNSAIKLTIKSGDLDFDSYVQINVYHVETNYEGKKRAFLNELLAVLNKNNYNKSDISTDYFDVGYYVYIHIGKWNVPYICNT